MKYSRAQRAEQRQQQDLSIPPAVNPDEGTGPIFFYREYEQPYGFMCQWYLSKFQDPDLHPTHVFNCAEQYMMYHKALILASPDQEPADIDSTKAKPKGKSTASRRDAVRQVTNDAARLPSAVLAEDKPGRQKQLARSVRWSSTQEKEWERTKFDVVVQGSWCKYSQNADLRARLLATGDRELVEASPRDTVWGIGFEAQFAEMNRQDWGSNLLGKALMSVRERLKAEQGTVGDPSS